MVIQKTSDIRRVKRVCRIALGEWDRDERVRSTPVQSPKAIPDSASPSRRTGRSPGLHAATAYPCTHSPQRRAPRHSSGGFAMNRPRTGPIDQQLSLLDVGGFGMAEPSLPVAPQCARCHRPARRRGPSGYHKYCRAEGCRAPRLCNACGNEFGTGDPGAGTKYCSLDCKRVGYNVRRLIREKADYARAVAKRVVLCGWCGEVATERQRAGGTWPFICSKCTGPIEHLVRTLKLHHVPHERARQLLVEPNCEICGVDLVEQPMSNGRPTRARLVVDHDHACCPRKHFSCGKCVRGLICLTCNAAAGMLRDDPDSARSLGAYLDRWLAP